ncbi:DUF3426 domain-containing protein [Oceanospirillum sp.]|uniref:DUF3426 domain-containing protein n=1 Tax=Oceanospirillum sp. TaxID=2021254 RepID=UPI003A939AEA
MMDDRLTRCPHCSTCFVISDADLQQAFGVARCGRCKKIFNAANHLFELGLKQHTVAPQSQIEEPDNEIQSETTSPYTTEQVYSQSPEHVQAEDIPLGSPLSDEIPTTAHEESQLSDHLQPNDATLTAEREDLPPISPDLHFSAQVDTPPQAKRKVEIPIPRGVPWIPASAAAGLVLLILILLWSNTRALSQSPGLSGFAEAICSLSGCEHYLPSDFDVLEVSQQAIKTESTQTSADLVLNNPTTNELPFPAILLELRDERGKAIAEFIYQPETYLQGKPFADQMLPPDLPIALTLPIRVKTSTPHNFSVRLFPSSRL